MKRLVLGSILAAVTAGPAGAQASPPVRQEQVHAEQAPAEATPIPAAAGKKQQPPNWFERARAPFKVLKAFTIPAGEGRVRMTRYMKDVLEVIGEEGEFLIVRQLDPSDPESTLHKSWLRQNYEEARVIDVEKRLAGKLVVTEDPEIYPPFTDRLQFAERSEGLPGNGKWQVSFDVADINADGRLDLVLPPPRLGNPVPFLYLGQKDGSWRQAEATWPKAEDAKLDYGAVRVADFDGDGHPDIAIACHFAGSYVLYGDGGGDFTRFKRLPVAAQSVTSRALAVDDFDGDGRPDIVLFAEVDIQMSTAQVVTSGLVNVVLNTAAGWQVAAAGQFTNDIHGDEVITSDLDGDGDADIVLTSLREGQRRLLWLNDGDGRHWTGIDEDDMPINSFVLSAAAGTFHDRPGLVLCFEQYSPYSRAKPPSQTCGIFFLRGADGTLADDPELELFYKRDEEYNNVQGLAVGDVDGDGRDDLAAVDVSGHLLVFLQFPDGTLYEERSPEVDLGGMDAFDVRIADLDGDGRGEVVVMGADHDQATGGVRVFSPALRAPASVIKP